MSSRLASRKITAKIPTISEFGLTITTSEKLIAIYEKPFSYWGRLPGRLFDQLIEMLQEPNWGLLPILVLTIPAAVLGGFLWQRAHPSLPQFPPKTVPHKPATLMNTILGLLFPILGLVFLCLLVLAITFYDEPAVVKAIKDRGGIVKGDPVVSVAFPSSASVSDVDLKVLKELTTLKTLNLDSTNITDEGLKELKELKSLLTLYLNSTNITDAGLNELKELTTLKNLFLRETKITDGGLKQFKASRPGIRVYK